MTFVKLEKIENKWRESIVARVGLRKVKNAKRASLILAIKRGLVLQADTDNLEKFDVFIGQDKDAGRIRIKPNADGIAKYREPMRANYCRFELGHIDALPNEQHNMEPCDASVVEGAIEIELPDWGKPEEEPPGSVASSARSEAFRSARTIEPAPPAAATIRAQPIPAAPAARVRQQPAHQPNRPPMSSNGVECEFSGDGGSIRFNGKTITASARGALLIGYLAKAMPASIDFNFLIGKLWTGRAPTLAGDMLVTLAEDLSTPLSKMGLRLNRIKQIQLSLSAT